MRRRLHQRHISVTVFSKIEDYPEFLTERVVNSPTFCSLNGTEKTIENVFKSLVLKYKGTSWLKEVSQPELHIVALKQFWLDCYVSDQLFMKLLFNSLPEKLWITEYGFTCTIESVQRASAFTFFSLRRYDKKIQKNSKLKKLICKFYLVFFCFLQQEVGPRLNKDNLIKVLTMADKKEKNQVSMLADGLLSNANKLRKSVRESISFDEFIILILS